MSEGGVTMEAVLRALGLNPQDPKVHALVRVAQRYDLDLLLGHILIVQNQIYISHAGLLHVAHRSGDLDGITTTFKESDDRWIAKCEVYRKSMSHPFGYTDECLKSERVKDHRKRAVTRAERNALRRAFDVVVDVYDQDERSPGPTLSPVGPPVPAFLPPAGGGGSSPPGLDGPREEAPPAELEEADDGTDDAADAPSVEEGGVQEGPQD